MPTSTRWTEQHDQWLADLVEQGLGNYDIAYILKFCEPYIRQQKRRLGLKSSNMRGMPPPRPDPVRQPPTPTHHLPGTPEKVEVMRQRYDNGEFIHHPQDAKGPRW